MKVPSIRLANTLTLQWLLCVLIGTHSWALDKRIESLCAKEGQIGSVKYDRVLFGKDLGRVAGFDSYGYSIHPEIVIGTVTIHQKGNHRRTDTFMRGNTDGQGNVGVRPVASWIETPKGFYQYKTEDDRWEYTKRAGIPQKCTWLPIQNDGVMHIRKAKVLGREVIDGKPCLKIQLRGNMSSGAKFDHTLWVWEDNGLEVRTERFDYPKDISPIKTYSENKNFSFVEIPDSVFEVPAEKIEQR